MATGIAAALLHALSFASTTDALELRNEYLLLRFEPTSGSLVRLRDVETSREMLAPQGVSPMWELTLRAPNSTRTVALAPSDAQVFECSRKGDALQLRWGAFSSPEVRNIEVNVGVRLPAESPDSVWSIRVEGLGDRALTKVRFPRVPALAQSDGETVAVPQWMGQQTRIARQLVNGPGLRSREWAYPGLLSMQCMAVSGDDAPGVYFASNDTAAYLKRFAMLGDGHGALMLEQTHLPEQTDASGTWEMPYESLVGTLRGGDWFSAAEHYREWAQQQSWARESRLRAGKAPDWLNECDLWVWNRGRSSDVLEPAVALVDRYRHRVGVFWHWWHSCAYDVGFPEYFPPREGTDSFTRALGKAQSRGVHAIVYMNQRLWGMTTKSWMEEGAEQFAVKGTDGKIHPEIYNVFTSAPMASMCMGTQFWRDKYASLGGLACRLGLDGIYMDQACSSLACYDPAHDHPIGGGRYWMHGFQLLQDDIRRRCGESHRVVLAGEGVAESWLPYLDVMLSLEVSRERYAGVGDWEVIPFFHAVYHANGLTFGNYSSLVTPPYDELWPKEFAPKDALSLLDHKYSKQFALEQTRSFVWGQQLTIANFRPDQFESRAEEIDMVLRLAKLRGECAQYLREGTMLHPPKIDVPATTIPISRLSIYAGRTGSVVTSYEKAVVPVLGAAWRADGRDVAVALASILDHEIEIPLRVRPEWQLPPELRVLRTDETGRTEVARGRGISDLRVKLPPRNACVIEFHEELRPQ